MSVKIGNQPAPVYPDPQVTPGEGQLPDVSNMSLTERLKLAKKTLEEKYGPVAVFKLPNQKRVFFRAPMPVEYQRYTTKVERIAWAAKEGNKITSNDTLTDCTFELIKACLITAADNSVIGNVEDLETYPAAYQVISDRLQAMAGSEVEEDFLD